MALADERAPNVSSRLRTRIGTLLDGGATVSLRRNSLVLKDVVLTRQNGTETPAAAEMRMQVERRNLDPASFSLDRWDRTAAVEQAGNQAFAFDRNGNRQMVSRTQDKQRVVTKAGRRFYEDAPLTQWIFQVPVANQRGNGALWRHRYLPLTQEGIDHLDLDIDLSAYAFTRGGNAQEEAATLEKLRAYIEPKIRANFHKFTAAYEYEDSVNVVEDTSRPITFDMQRTGITRSGAMSVDTLLDQVVFGAPVTSHDIWMKCHLHESSRRRNGECGIDVVVAA